MGKITGIVGLSAIVGGIYVQTINGSLFNHGYRTTPDQFFLGCVSMLISLVLIVGGFKLIKWGAGIK